jgi:hypothetical protein
VKSASLVLASMGKKLQWEKDANREREQNSNIARLSVHRHSRFLTEIQKALEKRCLLLA